jgi:hypothetical protein
MTKMTGLITRPQKRGEDQKAGKAIEIIDI